MEYARTEHTTKPRARAAASSRAAADSHDQRRDEESQSAAVHDGGEALPHREGAEELVECARNYWKRRPWSKYFLSDAKDGKKRWNGRALLLAAMAVLLVVSRTYRYVHAARIQRLQLLEETGGLSVAETEDVIVEAEDVAKAEEAAEKAQPEAVAVEAPPNNTATTTTVDGDDGSILASQCGVLVTSQGGVGSSAFMKQVESLESLTLNFPNDSDKFKHKPATYWKYHDKHALVGTLKLNGSGRMGYRTIKVCFKKVLVIIGDPIHTIESTYRRFKTTHLNKLRTGSGRKKYAKAMKLAAIYKGIADKGEDEVGLSHYISSWRDAQNDREHWPEIRLVTSKTLYNNAVDMARWIGVTGDDLKPFESLSYQESKHHEVEVKGVDAATMEKVKGVYQGVVNIVEAVDKGT
ncbi:hypothetical protein ACHAXT_006010 [Thalassiosira profunda]